MPHALPYHPDLGHWLRTAATATARPVWLRLAGGKQELFGAFPVAAVTLCNQALGPTSESSLLYIATWEAFWAALPELLSRLPEAPSLPGRFRGGLMGFAGYGRAPGNSERPFPTAYMGLYPRFIHIDHIGQKAAFLTLPGYETDCDEWQSLLENVTRLSLRAPTTPAADPLSGSRQPAGSAPDAPRARPCTPAPGPAPRFRLTRPFAPLTSRARYQASFARIQDYLHSGDCYQVNYAQAFRAECEGTGAEAMARLLAASTPGHAAWLALPEGEVMSLSPELFLRVEHGAITTRPIKGTAPRGATPSQDEALRLELEASAKNRAENLMIVDLLRHDIGQHAVTGSVGVDKLFEVESLPQVHHLVSTVTAQLRPDAHVVDLVRDCFPGGSITGAPKKRAMEIIAELEDTPRSVYCGSIGFIGTDGEVELNIAIRTLLRTGNEIYAWAGGGIVADSECEAEYEECFHKIGALMRALESM
ncbi:MAG: aminodeoxychorismate synthase [Moraxellaceae bacterium]|jgi:para-aminobenzoate synthetase component 1|nr:aminodeoxychorismate synthase [Moraxellaceae bacterium]